MALYRTLNTFNTLIKEYKELACDIRAGIPHWRKNFNEAVTESKNELQQVWNKCAPAALRRKFITIGILISIISLIGTSIAVFGIATTTVQILGFIGFSTGLLANRLKYNHHTLAMVPVGAGLIAAHMALLGGWSYVVMGLIAGSRAFVMSTLGNDKEHLRKRLLTGFGFYAVGLPAMLLLTFHTPWSLLTALAMTCGTVADVMTSNEKTGNDNSRYARAIRMGANISNAVYNVIIPQSWAAFLFDVAIFCNQISAIYKHDVSTHEHEQMLRGKLKAYFKSLIHL